uniref:Uncharacterized protein n=1 Tax=Ciona savignyi TaxID=51511 RepID=H2ZHY4_CIOSA
MVKPRTNGSHTSREFRFLPTPPQIPSKPPVLPLIRTPLKIYLTWNPHPPPYSVSVTRPQPAARETQSLLPSAPAEAAASSSQTYQQPAASSSESYQQPAASSSQTYQQPAASSSQSYQQQTTR